MKTPLLDLEFLNAIVKSNQTIIRTVQKVMESAQFALDAFKASIKKIPDSIKILAEEGWYLPKEIRIGEINRLATFIKEGDYKTVNKEMIELFDKELTKIQDELTIKFPNRKKPLMAAFNAHLKKEYYLSIPVFFAQIEGMCQELIGVRFFKNSKDIPRTKEWLKNFKTDTILTTLLEPLNISGPMRKPQDITKPVGINRHDVLHGNCSNYGDKKINSYKVLSLLYYIGDTVYDAKQFLDENYPER